MIGKDCMKWISFFEKQPEHGQDIWYYGEHIGVWAGEYVWHNPIYLSLLILRIWAGWV